MKSLFKVILSSSLLAGLALALSSCVADGYVAGGTGVYYGPEPTPWFHDEPWMDGRSSGFIGIELHPDRGEYRGRGDNGHEGRRR